MRLICFLLLLILACKSENNTLSERKEKSNLVLKEIEPKIINFNIDSLSSISLKKNIPFGNKQLIEFDFPVKERLFYGGLYQQDYKPTIKEKKDSIKYAWKYTSLSNYHLLKETQNLNISNNYVSKFLKIAKDIGEIEKSFKFNIQNIKSAVFLIELPKKGKLEYYWYFLFY